MNLLIYLDLTYNLCKNFKFYSLQGQNVQIFLIFTYNQGKSFLILPIIRGAHVYLVSIGSFPPSHRLYSDNSYLTFEQKCYILQLLTTQLADSKNISLPATYTVFYTLYRGNLKYKEPHFIYSNETIKSLCLCIYSLNVQCVYL